MADANLKVSILAVDKASKTLDKVGNKFSALGKVGLVSAGAVAAFGASSIKAFAEAEAAQAKLQDTFNRFPRLADVSLDSLRDYNAELQRKTRFDDDAIASGQAILGQYELTGKQLQELTPLVADFAAKTGQSFEAASEAVGKGLLGSGKAFKQIGIDFKDTGTQAGNLEAIMSGLRTQVGGFAEQEGQTAAGATERLKNQFGELQETIGQQLLPPFLDAVEAANGLLGKFSELSPAAKKSAFQIAALSGAAIIAAPKIADMASGLSDAVKGMNRAKAASIGATAAIAALSIAVISGTNSIKEMKTSLDDSLGEFGKSMNPDSLREVYAAIDKLRDKQEDLKTFSGVGDLFSDLGESTGAAIMGWTDINDAMDEYLLRVDEIKGKHLRIFQDVAREMGISVSKARELAKVSGVDLAMGGTKAADAIMDFYDASVKAKTPTEKLSDAQNVLNDEYASGEDKVKAFRNQLDLLAGGFLEIDAARDRAKGAQIDFAESLKQNGRTLSSNTKEGQANKEALRNIAESARDAAEAVFKNVQPLKGVEAAQGRANQEMQKGREAFIKAAVAAGRTKKEAEALATKYGLIPKSVSTKADFKKGKATKDLSEFQLWLYKQDITIPVRLDLSPGEQQLLAGTTPGSPAAARIAGARADGGPVRVGKTYIVGERGPELFTAPTSGVIIPNSGAMRAGGGGTTVVVNINGSTLASDRDIATAVTRALKSTGARGLALA